MERRRVANRASAVAGVTDPGGSEFKEWELLALASIA
jgi:hypothetical protein